jgi:hypothetical protein
MDTRLTAYRITDYMIPAAILQQSDIADNIYEDGASFVVPDVVNEFWIGILFRNRTIACYRFHNMSRLTWQVHARVLPEFRNKYGISSSIQALKWMSGHVQDINIICAFIPVVHSNVAKHAHCVGMKLKGILNDSYLKDGKIVDQMIYGITKGEIDKL